MCFRISLSVHLFVPLFACLLVHSLRSVFFALVVVPSLVAGCVTFQFLLPVVLGLVTSVLFLGGCFYSWVVAFVVVVVLSFSC